MTCGRSGDWNRIAWIALALSACQGAPTSPPTTAPTAAVIPSPHPLPEAVDGGRTYVLHDNVPFAELSIPADSRDGVPIGTGAAIRGLVAKGGSKRLGYTFTTRNPIKPRGLFYSRAPKGLMLQHNGIGEVPYRPNQRRATHLSWSMKRDTLTVRSPEAKVPENIALTYPRAVERERALHYATAKAAGLVTDEASFVRNATVQSGWTSREGLLLPAPARAGFDVEIPASGVLSFAAGLSAPEFSDLGDSDGCSLKVTLDAGEGSKTLYESTLEREAYPAQRIDLSAYAGKKARLTFETLPGATTLNDFCFVGEPILAPVKKKPRRVVMVFVDTVRPDHLSLYGYERETTPRLTAFAKDAAVFEQARSIAPWTLPSARTVVTGRHPEFYDAATTLPAALGKEGFATGMIAGNVYLTANFGMHRDWDLHTVDLFPPANEVTDQALNWLGEHEGTDSLLMVHYMSAHLPYKEPEPYLSMWAGERPSQLAGNHFILPAVRTADRQGLGEPGRQYIRDRYDQTLRWLDDEVARLFSALDDDDIVVFFSDHGEEFWDHGGYEHGHSLYDELLRVPLVIRAPGLQAGKISTPVSLLDITPTVLDLLEVDTGPADGTSLVKLAAGDATLTTLMEGRPQTFGRPLYGRDRWGVLTDGVKWTSHASREVVHDLTKDPGEKTAVPRDEAGLQALREAAAEPFGTQGGVSYRFLPSNRATNRRPVRTTVKIPGGIEAVWKGGDPHQKTPVDLVRIDEETVQITWQLGDGGREVYVKPIAAVADVTHTISGTVSAGNVYDWTLDKDRPATPVERKRLAQLELPEGAITVYWGMAPPPPSDAGEINATDDESTRALEELGYKSPDPEPTPKTP